jgi:hypothetical protein
MPRLNLYEMANPLRAPRASGAEFGAAPAQALESAGGTMYEIGERIQKREENAISDQALGELDTQALPVLSDFEKKHDIAMPEALGQFESALQKIKSDALSKTNLRPEARAALERQLDNQITQYGKSAIGMRIKAGHAAAAARMDQQFRMGINQVTTAPVIMNEVIGTNLAFVESRKDSMDPLTYQTAVRKAQAGPIQAAVNAYSSQEQWDQAEKIITDPLVNSLLEPDVLRSLRIDVAVGRGKTEQEVKRQEAKIAQFTSRLGRPLTPDEQMRVRTIPAKKDMTPADEITELELVQGKPASQDQVDKIFKTYTEGSGRNGVFGGSEQGRARDYLSDNEFAYANRTLDPLGMRKFEQAAELLRQPVWKMNPITKQQELVQPTLEPWIVDALNRGKGWSTGGAGPMDELKYAESLLGGRTGTVAIPKDSPFYDPSQPAGTTQLDDSGASWGREDRQSAVDQSGTSEQGQPPGLFQMGGDVAGIGPAVGRLLGEHSPIPIGVGGRAVNAKQYVGDQKKVLMRAMAVSPKYAQAEQSLLAEMIRMEPEMMSNPDAWELRMVAIARTISETMDYNAKVISKPSVDKTTDEQYKSAVESQNLLRDFYEKMRLPPKIQSTKDDAYLKLKPGEKYIDSKWRLMKKGGG